MKIEDYEDQIQSSVNVIFGIGWQIQLPKY